MQVKKKHCDGCNVDRVIWKNSGGKKYCRKCWSAQNPANTKCRQKPIPPRSSKRKKTEPEYLRKRALFLESRPMCEAHLMGCSNYATDVHHKKGRGKYFLDISTWLAVCRSCHTWIENHPKEAKEAGFSMNRNEKI